MKNKGLQSALMFSLLTCAALLLHTPSAQACLSCGCGSSGSSADLGAIGGASSLFSQGQHWLIQTGATYRQVTGSFNDTGRFNPPPVDSYLGSLQSVLGVNYFQDSWTLGLQLPFQLNALDGAAWGAFGSIAPTDENLRYGGGVGDIQIQGAYKFLETPTLGLAGWGSLGLPTGAIDLENPANTTGSGVSILSGGLLTVYKPPARLQMARPRSMWDWWTSRQQEYIFNIGYGQALNAPPSNINPFFQGQSLMAQLQANVSLVPRWTIGLGLNGQLGLWANAGANNLPTSESGASAQLAARWRVVPSVQYEMSMTQGVRLAMGADVPVLGSNSLTDATAHLVYYQFFE